MPIQRFLLFILFIYHRVPRYIMLLKDIHKYCSQIQADYTDRN
jgi:hypothetical protein